MVWQNKQERLSSKIIWQSIIFCLGLTHKFISMEMMRQKRFIRLVRSFNRAGERELHVHFDAFKRVFVHHFDVFKRVLFDGFFDAFQHSLSWSHYVLWHRVHWPLGVNGANVIKQKWVLKYWETLYTYFYYIGILKLLKIPIKYHSIFISLIPGFNVIKLS